MGKTERELSVSAAAFNHAAKKEAYFMRRFGKKEREFHTKRRDGRLESERAVAKRRRFPENQHLALQNKEGGRYVLLQLG